MRHVDDDGFIQNKKYRNRQRCQLNQNRQPPQQQYQQQYRPPPQYRQPPFQQQPQYRSVQQPLQYQQQQPNQQPQIHKKQFEHNFPVTVENADKIVFPSSWHVWVHDNTNGDWSLGSYDKIAKIANIRDFWSFANNFDKFDYMKYQFFIMRDGINPTWEDKKNIYGGSAAFRLAPSNDKLLSIWEDICLLTVNEQIHPDPHIITGVSFNLKPSLALIKIWNDNSEHDFRFQISPRIINNYKLKPVYIKHRPSAQ